MDPETYVCEVDAKWYGPFTTPKDALNWARNHAIAWNDFTIIAVLPPTADVIYNGKVIDTPPAVRPSHD